MKFLLLTTALFAAASDADLGGGGAPTSPTPPDAAGATTATTATATTPEIVVPAPPKGADFDTVASMHQQLLSEGSPAAEAFHKKHVLGFKSK